MLLGCYKLYFAIDWQSVGDILPFQIHTSSTTLEVFEVCAMEDAMMNVMRSLGAVAFLSAMTSI